MRYTYKILISSLFLTLFFQINSLAQKIELTPLYGYQLGSKLNYGGGFVRLDDGEQYGLGLGVTLPSDVTVEVSWYRQQGDLSIKDNILVPFETKIADMAVDWIQLGGMRSLPLPNEQIVPFGGLTAGVAIYTPSNPNTDLVNQSISTTTRFALSLIAGVKIMVNERIGFRLQGQLLMPVEWGGIYVGVGTGGPSTGASLGSTILSGAFSGGLVIGLGGGSSED